ncbi:unnamed protein product, partial [Trypanosoma congolense IL3000]
MEAAALNQDVEAPTVVSGSGGDTAVVAANANSSKRLFDLLQDDSKERVVRILTAFRNLTLLEKESLAQEMGVTLPKPRDKQAATSAMSRQLTGPALEVRRRDRNYVAMSPSVSAALRVPGSSNAANRPPEAGLCSLVSEFLGDEPGYMTVPDPVEDDGAAANFQEKDLDDGLPPLLLRSRSYQALRLVRDDSVETDAPYTKSRVLNITGMP